MHELILEILCEQGICTKKQRKKRKLFRILFLSGCSNQVAWMIGLWFQTFLTGCSSWSQGCLSDRLVGLKHFNLVVQVRFKVANISKQSRYTVSLENLAFYLNNPEMDHRENWLHILNVTQRNTATNLLHTHDILSVFQTQSLILRTKHKFPHNSRHFQCLGSAKIKFPVFRPGGQPVLQLSF